MSFFAVLWTEIVKLRRTRILTVLLGIYLFAPMMIALMMAAIKDPELGAKLGLLTAKAELTIGAADWGTYIDFIGFLFVGGIIVLGFAQAVIFGREYLEGTAKNLFSLPVRRLWVLTAKLAVGWGWFLCVGVLVVLESYGLGLLLDLPGQEAGNLWRLFAQAGTLSLQVLLLSSVPAFLAVSTKGIVAPIGFSVLFLVLAQFFTQSVLGPWFPWSIPLIGAGAAADTNLTLGPGSYFVLVAVFLGGFFAAWQSMERMDTVQ